MITISKSAAQQIRASVDQADAHGMALRIAAKRKQDGSIEYAMGFDHPESTDSRLTSEDIDIVVAPTSTELLAGVTLDYVELESGQFHFIFKNPNDPTFTPPHEE